MALSDCLQWLQWQDIPAGTSVCGTSSPQCGQYPCATCEHIQCRQQCKEYLESIKKPLESEGGKYYEEKADIKDIENIVFYILDGEIHIVFNEYELAPYVSGVIDLILCDCKW